MLTVTEVWHTYDNGLETEHAELLMTPDFVLISGVDLTECIEAEAAKAGLNVNPSVVTKSSFVCEDREGWPRIEVVEFRLSDELHDYLVAYDTCAADLISRQM